jgi:hypothetical protein
MANFAIVSTSGLIVNRVVLDEGAEWEPPEGTGVVAEIEIPLDIGGTYFDGVYTPPVRTTQVIDVAVTLP